MDRNLDRIAPQDLPDREAIKMNAEELAIYKECSQQAFMKRGLPYGAIVTGATYFALKAGFLKPNATYGYSPGLIYAAVIGSTIGLISYKAVCIQKVLDHPNSTLKQRIEASMKKYEHRSGNMDGSLRGIPRGDFLPEDSNFDTQAPMVSGLQMEPYHSSNNFDGFTNVNADGDQPSHLDTMDPLFKFSGTPTTYDELRQRNRDEYMRSKSTRLPPRQDDRQFEAPQTPLLDSGIPFDRDRVPQYQLND